MSKVFAIDPGTERSAWVYLVDGHPKERGIYENKRVLELIAPGGFTEDLVIESIESFGMPVGREVFETAYWIGRFDASCTATLLPRRTVKLHLCGSAKATDANIRAALIDRFGPGKEKAIGLKASPGPLYGIKTHLWQALALAVAHYDRTQGVLGVR